MKTKMKAVFLPVLIMLILALVFVGCAASDWDRDDNNFAQGGGPGSTSPDNDTGVGTPPPGTTQPNENELTTLDRMVVYNGEISIIIDRENFSYAVRFLTSSINLQRGEWFDSREILYQDGRATLVARVRTTYVHVFVDNLVDRFGLYNTNIQLEATDVSLAHRNRQAEIDEQIRHLAWLNEEMENATSHAVRVQIQQSINQTETRLHQLTTQQNVLNQQILFSTLTIDLMTRDYVPAPPEPPPSNTRRVFQNVWNVIRSILTGFLYVLAVLVPLAFIAIPLFFLIRFLVKRGKENKRAAREEQAKILQSMGYAPYMPMQSQQPMQQPNQYVSPIQPYEQKEQEITSDNSDNKDIK
ncbi:MAG: DUF4349 domain-containing protein [Firmicutes bacterium]|nr:DUF4349 domain-containing protein [Bacillota bacterium]